MEKSLLRKEILSQRQALSETEWQRKSNLICNHLINLPLFTQSKIIFAYFSFRKEADLSPLFTLNKIWAFPRCINQNLVWHLWQPGEPLIKDKYGINAPLKTAPAISVSAADLIIVPTVACDRHKYRLGYGGGFYDRLLEQSSCLTIKHIGIVFDFACIEQLPTDYWDMKLNFICTETDFF